MKKAPGLEPGALLSSLTPRRGCFYSKKRSCLRAWVRLENADESSGNPLGTMHLQRADHKRVQKSRFFVHVAMTCTNVVHVLSPTRRVDLSGKLEAMQGP